MNSLNIDNLPLWLQPRDTVLKYSNNVQWRYGEKPNYTRSNERLAQESQYNHPQNSLAGIVQNLVRNFDIEANFKSNPDQWLTFVKDKFRMSTNGGHDYTLAELVDSGTYKLLIGNTQHYQADQENFETSTKLFHTAFPDGFLWEVIDVYSPPPTITVKWRHWGYFKGAYKDYTPTGQMIEVIGLTIVHVTDDLKILSLEHYYDNNKFLEQLTSGGKSGPNSPSPQVSQEVPSIPSLLQLFLGFIKQFWRKQPQIATAVSINRCPFAAFVR